MDLTEIKQATAVLSEWAHVATVGRDGDPDVSPVHPAWQGDTIWFLTGALSVKARNISHHPRVAMHWQIDAAGDGVEVWGEAEIYADVSTKRGLWNGVFDYDLNDFAPGGPDDSPDMVFVAVRPTRAVHIRAFGMGGTSNWSIRPHRASTSTEKSPLPAD
ncbi:pyridoxamine 5'-phosphate oxidase family protein [Nocardia sp. NPDC058640]|uniref:pyridoxamine 5'-phosphate oxidase family protein n=1 Tax=Nocardia sp. NPDC058640 TaxID=3346571 RepID=UPI00364F9BBD